MKAALCGLIAVLCVQVNGLGGTDPVSDYLKTLSPVGGDRNFYSDDQLLRLDLDLNRDGKLETLLSLARDRNGKQGNIWQVYEPGLAGYDNVGGLTLNPNGFYLGEIDEIDRYGVVTFWPGGAGEGTFSAFIFDGSSIQQAHLGSVRRDPNTKQLTGTNLLTKYMRNNSTQGESAVMVMKAAELARKYGIKVVPKTYTEAIQEQLAQHKRIAARSLALESPSPPPSIARSSTTTPSATATTKINRTEIQSNRKMVMIAVVGLLCLLALLVFLIRTFR